MACIGIAPQQYGTTLSRGAIVSNERLNGLTTDNRYCWPVSSGTGKSTLARLLLRFFDPTQGRITLGGIDLRELSSTLLYQHIGFVLQEVRLIHASLRENIALGHPNASMQEIEAAAIAANIHDHILSLPRGYDSVVGEDAQLSGGEQQRVSIARLQW